MTAAPTPRPDDHPQPTSTRSHTEQHATVAGADVYVASLAGALLGVAATLEGAKPMAARARDWTEVTPWRWEADYRPGDRRYEIVRVEVLP